MAGPSKSVIDTIIAEAGGSSVQGMRAVAAVIANRANQWGMSPDAVVKQSGQFDGYSNPGSGSRQAQQMASVRQKAAQAWSDIVSGKVADPTNGGLYFHAASVNPGWEAPHGTVKIAGQIYYLGNQPQSALAAIDQVAPTPFPRPVMAYADEPAASAPTPLPPLPRADPRVSTLMPFAGGLDDHPAPTSRYWGPETDNWGPGYDLPPSFAPNSILAGASVANGAVPFVSEDHPLSNAVPALPGGLTSRSVSTLRIDPLTNQVIAGPTPMPAKASPTSWVPSDALSVPTVAIRASQTSPILQALAANGGAMKTADAQAGNVALPAGVVPASVTRAMAAIDGLQKNTSGSPDERRAAFVAPTPFPSRPAALNGSGSAALQAINQTIPGPSGYTDDFKDMSRLVADPSYTTKTTQVINPAYSAWQASQTPALKAGEAYTSTGDIVTQAQKNAFSGYAPSTNITPLPAAPPKYITKTVRLPTVPVPQPVALAQPAAAPAAAPRGLGGLLAMLLGGDGGGLAGLLGGTGGGAALTKPTASTNSNDYRGSDAPIGTLARQMSSGAQLPTSVVNSTRWQDGY